MLIMDRYILRQYTMVFGICFCSLTGLYIVADALGHLEEFLSSAGEQGGLLAVLAEYYSYRTLSFFDRSSAVLALVATMFTLAWLQRFNEFTALSAAGISPRRVVRPIAIGVAVVGLAAAVNRELIVPQFRDKFSRTAQDLKSDAARKLEPRFDNRTGILFRGKQLLTNQRKIVEPNFLLPRELDAHGRQLAARVASYEPADERRGAGYLFEDVSMPRDLSERPSLALGDGTPVVLTPRDAKWLAANQCFVVSEIPFEQLVDSAVWRQYASTAELIEGLHNRSLDYGADVRVTVHSRFVQPVLDMVLIVLGMPLVLRPGKGNVFLAVGKCVAVALGFFLVVLGFQYLGSSFLLSPVLAAWCPLILFVPIAAWTAEPLFE